LKLHLLERLEGLSETIEHRQIWIEITKSKKSKTNYIRNQLNQKNQR